MRAVGVQQRAGGVLGLLHVRLVEGVDPQHDAGGGGRDLPAQELGAQLDAGRPARCGSPDGRAASSVGRQLGEVGSSQVRGRGVVQRDHTKQRSAP